MAMEGFFTALVTVGLAEIGDKTQLALFCLASKTREQLLLFLGALLAFALNDGIAVLFGGAISRLVPLIYIKILAGAIFVIFGLLSVLKGSEELVECDVRRPFFTAFYLIFVSELGDKTQVAAALFAASYGPLPVFAGAMLALGLFSLAAIYLGQFIFSKIEARKRSYLAGALFLLIGLWQWIEALLGG
jgi:putative Ca2+/H+ antiporter (TMEM165/GDT1 family)